MPGGRRGGEVLLVSDDAFAYRTREKLPSDADLLDYMLGAPNMATQLVAVLLDQGVLEAPSDVTQPRTIVGRQRARSSCAPKPPTRRRCTGRRGA